MTEYELKIDGVVDIPEPGRGDAERFRRRIEDAVILAVENYGIGEFSCYFGGTVKLQEVDDGEAAIAAATEET